MRFEREFLAFLAPEADRLVRLSGLLARRGLSGQVLGIGGRRHLLVRLSPGQPSRLLVAHYDRVAGSPGALDNSAACLALCDAGSRIARASDAAAGAFLLFTDGEEAPAGGDPFSQGAYALATGLRRALGEARPSIFVFDVVGRGDRLLLSTAARREGASASADAGALDSMEALARASALASGLGEPARLPLPWSDDLGFALAGMPALVVSALPSAELLPLLRESERRVFSHSLAREELGDLWPPTWGLLHGPDDGPGLLERPTLSMVTDFAVGLCRACQQGGAPL